MQPCKHQLVVNLLLAPDTVELGDGFTRDLRGTGCLGVRDGVELRLGSFADLLQRSVAAA